MFFPLLMNLYAALQQANCPASIFFLEYGHTPKSKYPTQLQELAKAYHYLLNEIHIDPLNVVLCGDSSGGNLALQLLHHLAAPHPAVNVALSKNTRPGKLILISPWVSTEHQSPSFVENADFDHTTKAQLDRMARMWRGTHSDEFTDPLTAPETSWNGVLPPTLIIYGEKELLRDDISHFCRNLKLVVNMA